MTGSALALPPDDLTIRPHYTYLNPTDILCRVYNHTAGHGCLSWNPTIPSPPEAGGRFDRRHDDESSYMYLAEAPKSSSDGRVRPSAGGIYTAIVETLRPLLCADPTGSGGKILSRSEVECRSLQYFTVRQPLTLVSLSLQGACLADMGAPEEVLTSDDRNATQLWSSKWQSLLPGNVSGLAYNSTSKSIGKGRSVVLWQDRCPSVANLFVPASAEMPLLGSRRMTRCVEAILDEYRTVLM